MEGGGTGGTQAGQAEAAGKPSSDTQPGEMATSGASGKASSDEHVSRPCEPAPQQHAAEAASPPPLPGKIVLGPPDFVKKMHMFQNQGLSRLGAAHLMRSAADAAGMGFGECEDEECVEPLAHAMEEIDLGNDQGSKAS